MEQYKKIQGFNTPPGIPVDFVQQVRQIVWNYNKCIDEYNSYRLSQDKVQKNYTTLYEQYEKLKRTVDEQKINNTRLSLENEKLKSSHDVLKTEYEKLKTSSEDLANKYERYMKDDIDRLSNLSDDEEL